MNDDILDVHDLVGAFKKDAKNPWPWVNRQIDLGLLPPGRMMGRRRIWTRREILDRVETLPSDKMPPRGIAKANAARAIKSGGTTRRAAKKKSKAR
jgi:hypothetical protein